LQNLFTPIVVRLYIYLHQGSASVLTITARKIRNRFSHGVVMETGGIKIVIFDQFISEMIQDMATKVSK